MKHLKNIKNNNIMATKKATTTAAPLGLGLFAQAAAKQAPAKTAKTKNRLTFEVKGYEKDIAAFNDVKEQIENLEAQQAILEGKLKDKGRELFIKEYGQTGRMPENFIIKDGVEKVMFLTMDKYIKVTPEKQALLEKLKPEVLDTNTEYSFNAALLNKYGALIEQAIVGIVGMTNDEKVGLIEAKTVITIKKGTIANLGQYNAKLKDVYEMIQPIVALKAAGE